MIYTDKFFFLCRIPLSATGSTDVEILQKAGTTEEFPELFSNFEEKRSHAFNDDDLYSVIRADEIYQIVRTTNNAHAKELAFEESRANLITNLEHRVMQNNDKNAKQILKSVHEVELDLQ